MTSHATYALCAAAIFVAAGCATPLAHPLRAETGPWAEFALSGVGETGRSGGCDNFQGCVDSDSDGFAGAFVPQFSGGYAHVFADHIGVMVGLWGPAWVNQKKDFIESPLAATGYLTIQNEWGAVGVGGDVGFGGAAVMAGLEVGDAGALLARTDTGIDLRLGVWGRRFDPWEAKPRIEVNGPVGSWEAGARLTVGPLFFLQYGYYTQDSGVMDFVIYETSSYMSNFHTVTLGLSALFGAMPKGWL